MIEDKVLLAIHLNLTMSDVSSLHRYGSQMPLTRRFVERLGKESLMRIKRAVRMDNQVTIGTHDGGM